MLRLDFTCGNNANEEVFRKCILITIVIFKNEIVNIHENCIITMVKDGLFYLETVEVLDNNTVATRCYKHSFTPRIRDVELINDQKEIHRLNKLRIFK